MHHKVFHLHSDFGDLDVFRALEHHIDLGLSRITQVDCKDKRQEFTLLLESLTVFIVINPCNNLNVI